MLSKTSEIKEPVVDRFSKHTLPLHSDNEWFPIGTGNYYKGSWNHRAMSGYGVYVMPNGNRHNHL